jgi:hypothetical protein
MPEWTLWARGAERQRLPLVDDLAPQLDSWMHARHPDQLRLQAYLAALEAHLDPLPPDDTGLFLHMDIDVGNEYNLTHGHDIENYLCPVVQRLGPLHFTLVGGTKRVGYGSYLAIGSTVPIGTLQTTDGWVHFEHSAGSGVATTKWKAGLWDALYTKKYTPLTRGLVEVHHAWRCSMGRGWYQPRNWTTLWKPTGDSMGPVLGPVETQHPTNKQRFHPDDDRIVSLGLHLTEAPSMGYDVYVGMWWRAAPYVGPRR